MCSINGFNFKDEDLVKKMNKLTQHRGPDGTGVFTDEGVSFGHNRLSIIDLSEKAAQPMKSNDGNLIIIFNGEIYNYQELKKELQDEYVFNSESDTEVILAAYKKWGESCVLRLNGIFAFAIWDRNKKEMFLARDHVGVKPLYYYFEKGKFIFSSEIKAILEHGMSRFLNIEAFNHYIRVLYVPEPITMFKGIHKLPPGSYLKIKNKNFEVKTYWNPDLTKTKGVVSKIDIRERVLKSVEKQLISDRPVGVYLSGGIDSSIILGSIKKVTSNIKTFSIGFDIKDPVQKEKFNKDFNLARKTALFYKTEHHELLIKPEEVWKNLEEAIYHLDEPISNPTIVPMYILSKFAKEKVAVVLSGDGGDELFGGYERYQLSLAQDRYRKIPFFIRKILNIFSRLRKLNIENDIDRFSLFMFQKDELLTRVVSDTYLNQGVTKACFDAKYLQKIRHENFTDLFMKTDRRSWLVDEDLMRADKMSMAHGLEVRVPFLDKDLVEFAEKMSTQDKVSMVNTKISLKDAFKDTLPEYLFREPKRGWFSPGAKWLRDDGMYEKVKKVLSAEYYKETQDMFNWSSLQQILDDHKSKKDYNLTLLWSIMTFQIWAKRYGVITSRV